MLNLYFSSQTRVDDTNKDLPLLEPALHSLNSIEISIQDVYDVLLHLNVSKASGPYRHSELIVKYNIRLKTFLQQGISEPIFYGDLVYKFIRIVGKPNFSDQFKKK